MARLASGAGRQRPRLSGAWAAGLLFRDRQYSVADAVGRRCDVRRNDTGSSSVAFRFTRMTWGGSDILAAVP